MPIRLRLWSWLSGLRSLPPTHRSWDRLRNISANNNEHLAWLGVLIFGNAILDEAFQEYMALYRQAADKVERFDKRIEELAHRDEYRQNVEKFSCFLGVKTHTALSLIVEVGDFNRYPNAQQFSSYLGLVPGEDSSGDRRHLGSLQKQVTRICGVYWWSRHKVIAAGR